MADKKKKKSIVADLKKGVWDLAYRKKSDGTIRRAKGTLDPDEAPALKGWKPKGRPLPADTVPYWDVGKKAIRSFKDYFLQRMKFERRAKKAEPSPSPSPEPGGNS